MANPARLHLPLGLAERHRLHRGAAAVEAPARGRGVVLDDVAAGAVVGQLLASHRGGGVVGRAPAIAAVVGMVLRAGGGAQQ